MAERLKAAVLKTASGNTDGGSNPSSSDLGEVGTLVGPIGSKPVVSERALGVRLSPSPLVMLWKKNERD